MTAFKIDTEFTRHLARELYDAAQGTTPPLPEIPEGTLSAFGSALCAALRNVGARTESLRTDMEMVADASFAMAQEAESTDSGLAAGLGGVLS
ncbi:chemotaxis protein [Corynebacterium striatum]|uniref:chemotaxis protein n=1 Tax=Corynebacterium striatum TaxID=43770 RepID=UPI0027BA8674|nr:chemotaxis protein [Corynebacterium striatum]